MLEANLPTIETALQSFDKSLASGVTEKLPIRASYLLQALGVGLFARVFRLHGQFSHWLGISERFDVDVIMPEFVPWAWHRCGYCYRTQVARAPVRRHAAVLLPLCQQ